MNLAIRILGILLAGLLLTGIAEATTVQIGNTIYIYGIGNTNIEDVVVTIANTSCISGTNIIYSACDIQQNDSQATLNISNVELRLNESMIWINNSIEINKSKIYGWNVTTDTYFYQNLSNQLDIPRSYIRIGDGSNNATVHITDSEISYLGYNISESKYGLYLYKVMNSTIDNVSIHHLYNFMMQYSDNNSINNSAIYNNSWKGIVLNNGNDNNIFNNTEIYNNQWVANITADLPYGNGLWTTGTPKNDNNIFYNLTVHDNAGACVSLQSGNNNTISYSTIYNPAVGTMGGNRLLEFNGVTNSTAEYNVVHDGWRGLYDVAGTTNIFRNNTAYNLTLTTSNAGGLVLYNVNGKVRKNYNNSISGSLYNIFYVTGTNNTIISNNSISGVSIGTKNADIGVDSQGVTQLNNTIEDLSDFDNNISVYTRIATPKRAELRINYTNNRIMTSSNNATFITQIIYSASESSMFVNGTSTTGNVMYIQVWNSTIRPTENSILVNYSNDNILMDYQNFSISNISITLANVSSVNITLTNISGTHTLRNDSGIINSSTQSPVYFNNSLANGDYWITEENETNNYTPPAPVSLESTKGNFWINYTWQAGTQEYRLLNVTAINYHGNWDTPPGSLNLAIDGNWSDSTTQADFTTETENDTNITLDVGGVYNITKIQSRFSELILSGTAHHKISISEDNLTWITVNNTSYTQTAIHNYTFTLDNSARYIRYSVWKSGTGTPASITWLELQAFSADNITDSYNVSITNNSVQSWTNGSANTSINTTTCPSCWVNISVWAFNNSGTGTLSITSANMNTQANASTASKALPNWAVGYYVAGGAILAGALYGAYRRRARTNQLIIYTVITR